jgi:hypothetical protein
MVIVIVKETRLVVTMDDLDFGIRDVTFEAICSIGMAPLIGL